MKKHSNNFGFAYFLVAYSILAIVGEIAAISILSERNAHAFWYVIFSIPSIYFIAQIFVEAKKSTK